MSDEITPDVSPLGGTAEPETTVEQTPTEEAPSSIYGEVQVQWPDGTEDYLKNEPSIKPFVDKEGKLNAAGLLKSYHETKKSFGKDKVILPNENSSDDELNEFWGKLGAKNAAEEYAFELDPENTKLNEDFVGNLQKFAAENRVPVQVANKLAGFLNEQVIANQTNNEQAFVEKVKEDLAGLQTEYGQAYEPKLNMAKKVLDEFTDPDTRKMFDDPRIGANPAVIKALVNIGEKLYKEDGFKGEGDRQAFSPAEAQEQINEIMGDSNHPYHRPDHPNHKMATEKMLKLFEMRG